MGERVELKADRPMSAPTENEHRARESLRKRLAQLHTLLDEERDRAERAETALREIQDVGEEFLRAAERFGPERYRHAKQRFRDVLPRRETSDG